MGLQIGSGGIIWVDLFHLFCYAVIYNTDERLKFGNIMIRYAPEELKSKRAVYESRGRKRSYALLMLLILIEILYLYAVKGSAHSFWGVVGIILGALAIAFIVVIILPAVINSRMSSAFSKELKKVVDKYGESGDAEQFYNDLLRMNNSPKTMRGEIVWYLNISTALIEQGKIDESLALLDIIEEAGDKSEAEFIRKHKENIKKQQEQ